MSATRLHARLCRLATDGTPDCSLLHVLSTPVRAGIERHNDVDGLDISIIGLANTAAICMIAGRTRPLIDLGAPDPHVHWCRGRIVFMARAV